MRENFDIEDEARGAQKPVVRNFNASVTDHTLEIRLYWAGKGTTRIPNRGDYGSLISAISVDPSEYFHLFCFLCPNFMHPQLSKICLFHPFVPHFFLGLFLRAAFKVCSNGNKKHVTAYIVAAVLSVFVILLIVGILWWKGFLTGRKHGSNGKSLDFLFISEI